MKLKQILNEIGDSIRLPNGNINVMQETAGTFTFSIDNIWYICYITFPIYDNIKSKIVITVAFNSTNDEDDSYKLTNQNVPLKVLSYVVGGLELYIMKWKKKFNKNKDVHVVYVKFTAKQESDELGNKRARVYKKFIEKFASRYNVSVNFSGGTNEIVAKFDNLIM